MKKIILILVISVFLISVVSGDVYVKTKTHTDAMEIMGQKQAAKDEIVEQWIGNNIYTNITSKQTMIIDMNKKMIYIVIHSNKSYVETPLPLDMKKLLPAQAVQMMSMMKLTLKITPTTETKVINNWKCIGYDMDMSMMMMSMKSRIWVTQDVPFDWKKFQDMFGVETFKATMASMQIGDEVIEEMKKIKGFQVKTEMTMTIMGQSVKITSDVVEIAKKSAPAGVYTIPADYKKEEKLSMGALRGK